MAFLAVLAAVQPCAVAALHLTLVEADSPTNIAVLVRDEEQRPVAGAAARFALPANGSAGRFGNGNTWLMTKTDEKGLATARGIRWSVSSRWARIVVAARFSGEQGQAVFDFPVPAPLPPPPPPRPLPERPAPTPPAATIPSFPWPAPDPSARDTIERALLERSGALKTLGDIDRALSQALDATGYASKSYFRIPRGYALATQIERIFPDGTPAALDRFDVQSRAMLRFSLSEYLRALFTARPGHFRVIVFLVTDAVIAGSGVTATEAEASAWLNRGAAALPAAIRNLALGPETACTAMIYEFEREEGAQVKPRLLPRSPVPAQEHLEKAGILRVLQGGR